ncbi:MAG: hypothetical protein M3134_07635, partial [Actinomycetota bacterium]|nr:hypothetical protein [Actinomycetota bacterium]
MPRTRLLIAATGALALAVAAPASAVSQANDDLAKAKPIANVSQPADVTYDLNGAGQEPGETIAGAGNTVWFLWKPAQSGATYVDVCGPTIGSHVVRVKKMKDPAAPLSHANLVAAQADEPAELPQGSHCRSFWRAKKDVIYYIQVDRTAGSSAPHKLILDQDTGAPKMPTLQPMPGVTKPTASPAFSHPVAENTFVCAIDYEQYKRCESPHWLYDLKDGYHTFRVKAMDPHGNLSPTVSNYWKVDAVKPQTTITSQPGASVIEFKSSEHGKFVCVLDESDEVPCTSPYKAPALPLGGHKLEVRAIDAVGNADPSPAVATWTVA